MSKGFIYFRQFMYGFAIDFAYVLWITSVAEHRVLMAGIASIGIALPAILGYSAIFTNRFMMIPYLMGLFLGTVVSMNIFH